MEKFHPIIYSFSDGAALGGTVEAADAEEACRLVASKVLLISAEESAKMFLNRQLEVIAVIKGDPQFAQVGPETPLFPWT